MEPYNIILLHRLIHTCCGDCTNITEINVFDNLTDIKPENTQTSHFIFPVLGPSTATRLFGSYFIPLVEPPVLYYITERDDAAILNFLTSCVRLWPLIVVFVCLVMTSGFICWVTETWSNEVEFPRAFFIGWFDGFWWAFISMTTVGYGDKCPKSIMARVFAVAWILLGISTFSIIVAILSAKITFANNPPAPDMARNRVGALRHRAYDASVVAKHGGILVDIDAGNSTRSVLKLIRLLREKHIDGFILDRYTFILFSHYAYNIISDNIDKEYKEDIKYLKTKTIQSEKQYYGVIPSLGILVKNEDDYEYFVDFVTDNNAVLNACNGLIINSIIKKYDLKLEDAPNDALLMESTKYFWPTIITSILTTIVISFFGFCYELRRKGKKKKEYDSTKQLISKQNLRSADDNIKVQPKGID